MPRTREQNEKIREERRREIMEAAIRLFARNGFAETSISAVAKAVGVSHGTIFLYFATKEDLFRACLVEPLAEAEQHFTMIRHLEGSPLERIHRMIRDQVGSFSRMESYLRLTQYVIGLRDRFPDLAQELFDFAHRYVDLMIPVIEEGQELGELGPCEPALTAWAYFGFLNGIGLVYLAPPESPEWAEAIKAGLRIFNPVKPVMEG